MVDITDKSVVNEENQISVPEDNLKEEQKKEYEELVEKFKRECLKSYSIARSGEVIKKFDFPSFQPLTEAQRENKMIVAIGQAVAQAFIKSATVMGNTVHNAVVKTFTEAVSAQNSQAGTSNSQVPPQTATASAAIIAPVYTTASPVPTTMQGGSASGFPKGWDPSTRYGMHPDFFTTPVKGQFNASASQPMTSQPDPSATQLMGSQQNASVVQPNA
jgi:hypothetical protein